MCKKELWSRREEVWTCIMNGKGVQNCIYACSYVNDKYMNNYKIIDVCIAYVV